MWRPLEFAISFPEKTPGTKAGVAVDLNDPYRDGELYGEGVEVIERGDLRFRAYRSASLFDSRRAHLSVLASSRTCCPFTRIFSTRYWRRKCR